MIKELLSVIIGLVMFFVGGWFLFRRLEKGVDE